MSRKEGEKELTSVEDSVDASIQGLEGYIKNSKEILITAANNSTDTIRTNRIKSKKQKLEEKQLNGYFKRQTGEVSLNEIWT